MTAPLIFFLDMQILLHTCLGLLTQHREFCAAHTLTKQEIFKGNVNNAISITTLFLINLMHYWPKIWLYIKFILWKYISHVTQGFQLIKASFYCMNILWKNYRIFSAYNLSGSNCSNNERWLWLKFCPKIIMLNYNQGYLETSNF